MIDTNITPDVTADEPRKDKKRPIIAFALAALAIGGIGAAATSAAWTDNVFFSAGAEAATFNLQGSIDGGTTWKESSKEDSIELVIPADKLANLLPGQSRTIDLSVKNLGSVGAALTSSVEIVNDAAKGFTTMPTATIDGLSATLSSATGTSASDQFQLKVTTPPNWDAVNQGGKATIIVTISGEATAG